MSEESNLFTRVSRMHESLVAKRHSRAIKHFDTDIKLELLFLIYLRERDPTWGIGDYVSALTSSPQSNSSMTGFVRDMLDAKVLEATESDKQTRKHLKMSPGLWEEFKVLVNVSDRIARTNFSKPVRRPSAASPYRLKGDAFG